MTERKFRGRDMLPGNETHFRGLVRLLEAAGRSEKTIAAYHQACLSLQSYLEVSGQDTDLLSATRDQVADWLIALQTHGGWTADGDGRLVQLGRPLAKDSVVSYFGSVRRFFNWAVDAELIDKSPMAGMTQPPASGKLVPIVKDEVVRDILATCRPRGVKRRFDDIRDEFILRLFNETGGPRCAEVALAELEQLDLSQDLLTIHGKGGKWRVIALSPNTAMAGQRYLQARKAHRHARSGRLFLGIKGPLSESGVYQICIRRSQLAGHGKIHPHQYRHTGAHAAMAAGMSEGDIMELAGWSSPRMLRRYGAIMRQDRALNASRAHNLGSRF